MFKIRKLPNFSKNETRKRGYNCGALLEARSRLSLAEAGETLADSGKLARLIHTVYHSKCDAYRPLIYAHATRNLLIERCAFQMALSTLSNQSSWSPPRFELRQTFEQSLERAKFKTVNRIASAKSLTLAIELLIATC